jgi:hypothetical protein
LRELAVGLSQKVEKHILEHTEEVLGKASHSLFKSGLGKEGVLTLLKDTVKTGGKAVLSQSEGGGLAWVIEKSFSEDVGAAGEKVLRVVVDKEGKVITAFPVKSLLKRVAIQGIQVSAQLAVVAILLTQYEGESQAAEADTAERYKKQEANKSSLETALEWLDPTGLFESSPIALEPNFNKIRERTSEALNQAQTQLGRPLTSDETETIRQDIYNIWSEASGNYNPP